MPGNLPAVRRIDGSVVRRSRPTVEEFAARIEKSLSAWTWLIAEQDGRCIGYAYGHSHRERAGYRWSVEVTIYVEPGRQQQGIGRQLYQRLFNDLATLGYCNVYAGVTQPNESSMALHRQVGFEYIGTFRCVGRKFDRWHDVAWFQRPFPSRCRNRPRATGVIPPGKAFSR